MFCSITNHLYNNKKSLKNNLYSDSFYKYLQSTYFFPKNINMLFNMSTYKALTVNCKTY